MLIIDINDSINHNKIELDISKSASSVDASIIDSNDNNTEHEIEEVLEDCID